MKQVVKDMWDAHLYDGKHSFVSEFGHDLINMLSPKKGERILDIGCGTGDLADKLFQYEVDVTGIDKSENMINQACIKYPHIRFMAKDVLEMEYNNSFDAIFSNATLHWIKEPQQALSRIYTSLKPGGRFVAEFGGKGNVQKITDEIINAFQLADIDFNMKQFPWYFPSVGEYTSLMERVGFHLTFACHFDRPTPLDEESGLRDWITMFAGEMFKNQNEYEKERLIKHVENNLRESLYQDGCWIADYKRIRVIGIKE